MRRIMYIKETSLTGVTHLSLPVPGSSYFIMLHLMAKFELKLKRLVTGNAKVTN